MKLICYLNRRPPLDIRPAPMQREWMEQSSDRFAYRCLPLNIANAHGWEICCDETVEASWNGGKKMADITVKGGERSPAISHFGSGVLTFHVACVFRTDPGWNLMAMGPPNRPKRGIQALTGVIETDWAPYSFTMNWIFTEPHHTVRFEKGEPFCFFFPVPRGVIENTEPEFCAMDKDLKLHEEHCAWIESRQQFIQDLSNPSSQATQQKWQRNYFQGQPFKSESSIPEHQTRVRAKTFQK